MKPTPTPTRIARRWVTRADHFRSLARQAPTGSTSSESGGALPAWLLILALAAAAWVMLVDFVNLRAAHEVEHPTEPAALPLPQPWGGYAWRELSRGAGDAFARAPEAAATTISTAASQYPLDATQWLDIARIRTELDVANIDRALDKARATQPLNREALWRAAQIALRTGNADLAERKLRQWLAMYPRDTGRALFIGARWIEDPGELIDRMLPAGHEFLIEAMSVARRQRNVRLGTAVWDKLERSPGLDDRMFTDYASLLLDAGEIGRALELWAERDPEFDGHGIANGRFSRPVGPGVGLNWRINRAPPSVDIQRDSRLAFSDPASLRISFNGKENVSLSLPTIQFPVEAGQLYRLTGMWRADGLTTRSLPYFDLRAGDVAGRARVPVQQFDWESWSIEFEAPADARLATLVLRRDRTNAFDRNIDGTLWIDDVRLVPMDEVRGVVGLD